MPGGGLGDRIGNTSVADAGLDRRRVAHRELTTRDGRRRRDLEIILDLEITNLDFAQAHDCQGRRLDPADADHALGAARDQHAGGGAGQRQVEDLVGLLAGDGCLVERVHLPVGLELVEGLA